MGTGEELIGLRQSLARSENDLIEARRELDCAMSRILQLEAVKMTDEMCKRIVAIQAENKELKKRVNSLKSGASALA